MNVQLTCQQGPTCKYYYYYAQSDLSMKKTDMKNEQAKAVSKFYMEIIISCIIIDASSLIAGNRVSRGIC